MNSPRRQDQDSAVLSHTKDELVEIPLNAFVAHFRRYKIRKSLRVASMANIATFGVAYGVELLRLLSPLPVWLCFILFAIGAAIAYYLCHLLAPKAVAEYSCNAETVDLSAQELHRTSDTRGDNLTSLIVIVLINGSIVACALFFNTSPPWPSILVNLCQLVPAIISYRFNRETVMKSLGKTDADGGVKLAY